MQRLSLFVLHALVSAVLLGGQPIFLRADELGELKTSQKQVRELTDAGRYREAEPIAKQTLARAERSFQDRPLLIAEFVNDLAVLYYYQARYAETEPLFKRVLAIRLKALGDSHLDVAQSLNNLAQLFRAQAREAEAEPFFKRALAIREKELGDQDLLVAVSLNNLAVLYTDQARGAEGEPLLKRALAIREKALGGQHPDVAQSLNNLGTLYIDQGNYAPAETLYKRALAIWQKALGDQHPQVAQSLDNLAELYRIQSRFAEAEPLYKRAIATRLKALGDSHPDVARSLNNLAVLYRSQSRYAEAEPLYKRALAIRVKVFGEQHPEVAESLNQLALFYTDRRGYAEAEPLFKRALSIWERSLNGQHPYIAQALSHLANMYYEQGRYADAELLIDRAISIWERAALAPAFRFESYLLRARTSWKLGRKNEALVDLRQALDLAEQVRHQSSGADRERAGYFSRFSPAFEQMVAWQVELGDPGEALQVIERGRARSLLDEMNRGGADLNLGRSAGEREAVREKEAQLKGRIAQLEKQLEQVDRPGQPDSPDLDQLRARLAKARNDLYEQYRDERNSSPVYRNLLSIGSGPPRLSQLQRTLLADNGVALVYLFGNGGGYVVVLGPQQAVVVSLNVDQATAEALGVSAGPLTLKRLQDVLVGADNQGIVPQLATQPDKTKPEKRSLLTTRLAALWRLLVPEAEREALTSGKRKRLIVVPDGPLALLPFEALIVQGEENPEYLLDNGPPILYGPSLSVLSNLAARPIAPPGKRKPVLTVADPIYPADGTNETASRDRERVPEPVSRSRYAGIGGQLNRLPYTAEESAAVADAFKKSGIETGSLQRDQATESIVRFNVSGRKIVHLACHGLTDQAYGNFFGALALTPGKQAGGNSADDGFLTLPEIYELDLKGCELAILSACQTNYGPQQQGEGVWALSRGFLVAGARRVVASNWLVDDEAGARLISYFCAALAEDEKQGNSISVDYAARLQAAKKWVRSQNQWKSPYYWSSFVLVGS